jgi:ATP-dependent DNA helicase RecG
MARILTFSRCDKPSGFSRWLFSVEGKPNVAGLILLCDEPQAVLPKRCGVKIYRYKTTDNVGSRESLDFDPLTIEGCAYEQIKNSVEKTTEIIQGMKKLGEKELEDVEYPNETLHEIITNAVIHRDYSVTDDVHIRIFDNRVEVQSPGRLPAHITVDNILDERFARNGKIVRILNKFPSAPNKDVGEGLNTAFDAMKQLGLKEPIISEVGNSVIVSIRHEKLASPEEAIMRHLDENGSINNSEARKVTYISADYRVKAIFNRLVDRGLIEQIPGTDRSTTRYRRRS